MLLQNVLSTVMLQPVSELYTADYDRIVLRRDLFRRSGLPVSWRRTRRASSELVYACFRQHRQELRDILVRGKIVPLLGMEASWIDGALEGVTTVGDSKHLFAIMQALALELLVRSIDAQFDAS